MQKLRAALSGGERGDQAALTQMKCVDKSTVSEWQAIADLMCAMEDKVGLNQLSEFQPTHAKHLARHLRRTSGKDPEQWDGDEIADWVEKCESEKLTVEQFKAALLAEKTAPESNVACTVEDLNTLVARGEKYGTVYADPPWSYSNQATRASTDNHYLTMSIADITALPVGALAADYCHLHLWTTNAFLRDSFDIIEAWGFKYQGVFVWCKPQMGIGNCWRVSHEFLVTAIKGEPRKFAVHDLMSWGEFDRTRHSAKPAPVRGMVERASPGPRLELFGREVVDGWTVWGNQISRNLLHSEVQELR
jgi:N6-adenosine-specific RNA methylase IME4